MRRDLKILLLTLCCGVAATWGPRLPEAMSGMDTFRIAEVEVRGIRYMTEDTVVARMALGSFASVWGDREAWAERIAAHPLVESAEVRRRLPNGLRVTVRERQPVALAPTPTLEPLDAEGYRLPIDPARFALDLPILAADKLPPDGAALFPEEVRRLAVELGHLLASDEQLVKRISTMRSLSDGTLAITLTAPDVEILLPVRASPARLRQAQAALADAMNRNAGRLPRAVDIRFRDQVVVRQSSVE